MNKFVVPARQSAQPGGIGSLESILGLLINLKIMPLVNAADHLLCEGHFKNVTYEYWNCSGSK
jgi:hypothetical protein